MKNWKMVSGVCCIGFLGIVCMSLLCICHKLYANEQNLLMAYEREVIPQIVCIGDSLTQGTGGGGVSYPSHLEELLNEDKLYIPVVNLGVGGENTVTIAARMGAIPFRVEEFTIPADTQPVEIHFISEENKLISPCRQGDSGINPVVINGVTGRIDIEQMNYTSVDYKYYFTRSSAGEEVEVGTGADVITFAQSEYKDGIFIIWMGENHGYDDIDDLIAQQKAILSLQDKNADKYLIIGLHTGTAEERAELEQKMEDTYGDKYVNIREYMSTVGPGKADVEINDIDREKMEAGIVPDCLLADGIHFNKQGYTVIAKMIYEKMNESGYFENLNDKVNNFGKF